MRHPIVSPLYDVLDHTNQLFSESLLHSTTGFYMAKLDEIGYRVCSSGFSDVYETIQNPEFQNPAIGGI